ncbi:hypothetical protein ABZ619_38830 [Streptomyces sp. NPDC007851]|uniref:hypothetical protein n=1 Tax=Streptomyces sp. NPDC007851 TaxID=3155008 RepID=UPI003404E63E
MATPTEQPSRKPCAACDQDAVVNWLRRLTDAEVAEVVAVEEERRAEILRHADQQLPPPEFGPLPTGDGMTRTVLACAQHAITLDAAALVHQKTCTAPDPAVLPGCNCTPEASQPEAPPAVPDDLPDHWVTGS